MKKGPKEKKENEILTNLGWLSKDNREDWKQIEEYYSAHTMTQTGKYVGMRVATLKEYFNRLEIPIRDKGGAYELRKATVKEIYGVDHIQRSKEVRNKMKQTCLEKYGHEHALQSQEVIDKRAKTNLERYGVISTLQTEEVKEKTKKICLEKYGVENPNRSEGVRSKIKETCLEKYGYEHPNKSPEVLKKRRDRKVKENGELLQKYLLDKGYELTEEYIGKRVSKLIDKSGTGKIFYEIKHIECGNTFEKLIHDKVNIKCPFCYPDQSSGEIELRKVVGEYYQGKIEHNRRGIIPYKEIDILLPSINIAFEYNGGYWHSTCQPHVHKGYHRNKTDACLREGIKLYHIWEYNNLEIVKSMISAKLGVCNKYFARKLIIKEVDVKERKEFFYNNHLHGDVNANFAIGLYDDETLIQCISMRKHNEGMEIARLASRLNTNVIGGFSKLLKEVIKKCKDKKINKIITFCDRDWTPSYEDSVYYKQGFSLIGDSGPSLQYFHNRTNEAFSRENFQKHKLQKLFSDIYDENLTADEMCISKGYFPIYNSGNWKFSLDI